MLPEARDTPGVLVMSLGAELSSQQGVWATGAGVRDRPGHAQAKPAMAPGRRDAGEASGLGWGSGGLAKASITARAKLKHLGACPPSLYQPWRSHEPVSWVLTLLAGSRLSLHCRDRTEWEEGRDVAAARCRVAVSGPC